MFADDLVGLGLLYSASYIKPIPTHEKIFAVGKRGPNATFNLFLGGVGLALGWPVRQFHNNIFCLVNRKKHTRPSLGIDSTFDNVIFVT